MTSPTHDNRQEPDAPVSPTSAADSAQRSVEPQAAADSKKRALRKAWRDFGLGLWFTAILIGLKFLLEHGQFSEQIEQMTLNLQQLRLASGTARDLPVVVVDITNLPRGARAPADPEQVTDRQALLEVVAAIADRNPATVGVDVLFDPPVGGALTADEVRFLEFCLNAKSSRGDAVPIFVGIFDGVVRGAETWLGQPRFADLAAFILVPKPAALPTTTSMVRAIDIPLGARPIHIDSLAQRLADAKTTDDTNRHSIGRWLARVFPFFLEREREVPGQPFTGQEFAIDFGALPRLMTTTVPAATAADVAASRVDLTNKIVLVGRAQTGRTTDLFTVPAQAEPVAGVYVHAAAAYTLVESPLFELTTWGRVAADLAAALVPLVSILAIRWWRITYAKKDSHDHELARRLMIATAIGIFVLGYFFIVKTGILWTDYLMVVLALLLHGPLERLGGLISRLVRRVPAPVPTTHGES